jgi:HTH-type transcriptional repressor of NAD biosynthesis genes
MTEKIKKIIFVGPESTGKTTLCKFLSDKYSTPWVSEMCRIIAEEKTPNIDPNISADKINFNFNLDDFINMANRQNQEEHELTQKAKKILICDNDSFALSIWCERYLGKYYMEIYDIYNNATHLENQNKIYILTKPNVPFVQDGLRDGEHIRDWMYNRFLEELQNKKMNYYVIDSPIYQERIDKAIEIIERIMDSNNGFQ